MTSRQYNGQEGIELALKILQHEFKLTMGLAGYVVSPTASTPKLTFTGCRSVKEISRSHVTFLDYQGLLAKL